MALPVALYFGGLVAGVIIIPIASQIAVSNLDKISEKRRLRQSVLGFLVVAMSTSLPELIVAINAIIIGQMSVSLGDIMGSNIVNVALIMGLSLITMSLAKKPVELDARENKEFATGLMLVSVTLLGLLYIQQISRIIGVVLVGVFIAYSMVLIKNRRLDTEASEQGTEIEDVKDRDIRRELGYLALGLVGVILSARLTLESAISIASFFEIPASIIGATLIAFGTSLPELAVSIRAASSGYLKLSLGNVIGSNFLNSTLILGILLVFTPPGIDFLVLSDLILFSVTSNLLLWYFIDTQRLNREAGIILLSLYLINTMILLGILQIRS
jgi:cation:H+ antiporter